MGIYGFIFRRWIMTSFPEFNGNSLIRNKISLLNGAKQAQQPNTRAITTNSWLGKVRFFQGLEFVPKICVEEEFGAQLGQRLLDTRRFF